jgi:hypothetical protein
LWLQANQVSLPQLFVVDLDFQIPTSGVQEENEQPPPHHAQSDGVCNAEATSELQELNTTLGNQGEVICNQAMVIDSLRLSLDTCNAKWEQFKREIDLVHGKCWARKWSTSSKMILQHILEYNITGTLRLTLVGEGERLLGVSFEGEELGWEKIRVETPLN